MRSENTLEDFTDFNAKDLAVLLETGVKFVHFISTDIY
jgi:hypothetical protein